MNSHSSRMTQVGVAALLVALFVLSLGWFVSMNYQAEMRSWDLAFSAVLLAVPLALLYFSIGVLVSAAQQRHSQGQITARQAKFIYYTPRIAGVVIILFVTMFSLDVFGEGVGLWEGVLAFILHSLPSIAMAVVLALAWRRPAVGFVAFLLVAVFFLRFVLGGRLLDGLGHILLFSGPMAVIAMLFWANWKWLQEINAARNTTGGA